MPELQEGRYAGEFVVSEGNGRISRETITVLSGENLEAGAVLGKVTASGKYKALDPAATDGSEVAAGILYVAQSGRDRVDAYIVRADGTLPALPSNSAAVIDGSFPNHVAVGRFPPEL